MIQGELKYLQFPQSLSLNIVDESLLVVKVISQALFGLSRNAAVLWREQLLSSKSITSLFLKGWVGKVNYHL